jgi:hypothetical protein
MRARARFEQNIIKGVRYVLKIKKEIKEKKTLR